MRVTTLLVRVGPYERIGVHQNAIVTLVSSHLYIVRTEHGPHETVAHGIPGSQLEKCILLSRENNICFVDIMT